MRILVIGDAHFRLELPYGTYFNDGRRGEWEEVKKTILETSKDCDAVVFLGDVLDKRHNHSSVLAELTIFLKALGDKEIHIISGNHEKFEGSRTALDFLKGVHHKWHIHTEPHLVKLQGVTMAVLPYMTNAELGVETFDVAREMVMGFLKKHEADLLFYHHAMSGSKTLGGLTDLFNEIVLDRDELSKMYRLTIGGHIHQPQANGNVMVGGSLLTADAGEEDKRVIVLDTDAMITTSVPLPVRPIHKIEFAKGMELDTIPRNAIVKATLRDPEIGAEHAHMMLGQFDAHILIEDYPNDRTKAHLEEANDLSIESLLRTYAAARGIDETQLMSAFDLIRE